MEHLIQAVEHAEALGIPDALGPGALGSGLVVAGGCILFSMKRRLPKGGSSSYVLPSAGTDWWLNMANAHVPAQLPISWRLTTFHPRQHCALCQKKQFCLRWLSVHSLAHGVKEAPPGSALRAALPLRASEQLCHRPR